VNDLSGTASRTTTIVQGIITGNRVARLDGSSNLGIVAIQMMNKLADNINEMQAKLEQLDINLTTFKIRHEEQQEKLDTYLGN